MVERLFSVQRTPMADTDDDLAEHQRTWHNFTRLLVVCMVGIALVLVFMAVVLL